MSDLDKDMVEDVKDYLDDLRDSGVANMFGAGVYLEEFFDMPKKDARVYLTNWMQNFEEEG